MWLVLKMPESLSDQYAELLSGSYDCADRIVLNAYFRMGHTAACYPELGIGMTIPRSGLSRVSVGWALQALF